MASVPLEDEKAVEVRLAPTDIDQVSVGQKARLRFPAFNQRTTPELDGSIARVAPDLTKDPQSGAAYYVARIKIAGADLAAFKQMKLVAGMPVESYIETGERTALSYLTKPFTDQLQRAFREE
jgi:HlyD family secretion protein